MLDIGSGKVLGHIKPLSSSKEALFKRRISASSAGAAVLGSSKDLGIKSEKHVSGDVVSNTRCGYSRDFRQ